MRLGSASLLDVISRAVAVSDEIGSRALLIHADSDEARGWYAHVLPDLEQSPTDPVHLALLMKDARAALA
ncbi:MAG: hypothetical protein AAGD18_08410 [Actinomycetota bacterium]